MRYVAECPGVSVGSVVDDGHARWPGDWLQVGELARVDPFELVELARAYGGPGAVERLAVEAIGFSLDLGRIVAAAERIGVCA